MAMMHFPSISRLNATSTLRLVACLMALFFIAWLAFAGKPWVDGLASLSDGEKPDLEHYMVTGLYHGAIAGAVISVIALLAAPLLAKPVTDLEDSRPSYPKSMTRFVIGVCAVVIAITATKNFSRLNQSLWDDEEKAMRMFIVGKVYQSSKTGEWKFKEAKWVDTFFNYRLPNNHILFSAAAKLSHSGYDPLDDAADHHYFSEWRLRIPSFLAGLGTIAALAWLLTTLGFQRAAVFAMPLLAMHPWFLRYLVEARGYTMVMLATVLAMVAIVRALQSGKWRWWLAFSALQFCMLYTYPVALHIALMMNICGVLVILFSKRLIDKRLAMFGKLISAGLLMSAILVFLMGPAIPQLQAYIAEDRHLQTIDAKLTIDSISLFFTGTTWKVWDQSNPLARGLQSTLSNQPILFYLCAIVLVGSLLAGAARLVLKRSVAWIIIPVAFLPPVFFIVQSHFQQTAFYPWYIITTITIVPALIALGLDYIARPLGAGRFGSIIALTSFVIGLVAFNFITKDQRQVICNNPIEPKRNSFKLYRKEVVNPFHPAITDTMTIGFHQENNTYDPRMFRLNDVDNQDEIFKVIAEADRTGKPLYVDFAQEAYARLHFQKIFTVLDDPTKFKLHDELYGLEPQNTRKVMRYVGNNNATKISQP